KRFQLLKLRLLNPECLAIERYRDVAIDRRQFLTEQDAVPVVLQAFAIHLARDLTRAIQGGLKRSELLDEVFRALVTDTRRARNVVDRVSFEGKQIRYLARLDTHELLHLRRVV